LLGARRRRSTRQLADPEPYADGNREGDRIALAMPNHWQYAVLLMALFRSRAVACPIPAGLPAAEMQALLES